MSAGQRLSLHVAHEIMVDEINGYIVQKVENIASVNAGAQQWFVDKRPHIFYIVHIVSLNTTS